MTLRHWHLYRKLGSSLEREMLLLIEKVSQSKEGRRENIKNFSSSSNNVVFLPLLNYLPFILIESDYYGYVVQKVPICVKLKGGYQNVHT